MCTCIKALCRVDYLLVVDGSVVSLWQAYEPAEGNLPTRNQPPLSNWLFRQEVPIPEDVASLIIPTQQPITAYTTSRDSAIFTTKRLILRDVWGAVA